MAATRTPERDEQTGRFLGHTKEIRDERPNERSEQAREALAAADALAYLLDLDAAALRETVHEQPLVETFRVLNIATVVSRDLHQVAADLEFARDALRERLSSAIVVHDQQEVPERPRLLPAAAAELAAERASGPGRAR